MKIAIVFEIFLPVVNGIITSSVNLAENLIAQGHEVIFIAPQTEDPEQVVSVGDIPVFYIQSTRNSSYPGMRNVLPWNRRVEIILKREAVDILHITGPWLLTIACIRAAGKLKIPVVHTFHTMLHEPAYILYMFKTPLMVPVMKRVAWWWYRMFVTRAVVNTGPSQMVCSQLQQHFPDSAIHYVSNGVDVARFGNGASRKAVQERYPEFNETTMLYVGRVGSEKSVDELVEAIAILRPANPDIRLFVVGDGPAMLRCTVLARALGVTDQVSFLGRIPHEELLTSGLIQNARAFITASTTENQPMTVIEATCCGIPALVPDVEGIRELVSENGLLFIPHNVKDIARAIRRICTDNALHASCSQATETMKNRYDGASVAQEFIHLYQAALEKGA